MGMRAWATLWGLAEATLFFIVPDVLMSRVALDDLGRALRASLWALLGALIGGAVMYAWGVWDQAGAISVLQMLPAVNATMVERVEVELSGHGVLALFIGALTGTPYKIYATQSWSAGVSLFMFLLVSIPARLLRFMLVASLAALAAHLLRPRLPQGVSMPTIWAVTWLGFYAAYFLYMA